MSIRIVGYRDGKRIIVDEGPQPDVTLTARHTHLARFNRRMVVRVPGSELGLSGMKHPGLPLAKRER